MAYVPNPNQSVSGTVGASIIGLVPVNLTGNPSVSGTVNIGNLPTTQNVSGSVLSTQGTNPWIITGSVQASLTPAANQSVSGTVQTDVRGSVATVIIGGSIAASFTPPANQSVSGTVHVDNFSSVIAYQLAGSVLATSATVNPAANQSVSGTVQTDVRSSVAVVIIGGSIAASFTPPANQSVSGEVNVKQTTNPWIITGSIQGTFSSGNSSVQVLNFPANQSVSGAVSVSNFPTTQNVSGSVVAFPTGQYTVVSSIAGGIFPISGSVGAVVTNFPTTQNVSGSVAALQGTNPWIVTSSVAGGIFPVSGSVSAVITNNPTFLQLAGSVLAVSGSFTPAANQSVSGTVQTDVRGSVATVIIGGSIAASFTPPANQSVSGTVGAAQIGSWSASVGGTVSVLGTVPVTQSGSWTTSVFTATPGTAIRFSTSIVSTSVTLIAASAAGKKNYVTDFWATNTGATTTLLTFKDGSTSVLGYTIVPTGGGSNSPGITTPMVTAASQDLVFQPGTASSIIYLTVNGYQI